MKNQMAVVKLEDGTEFLMEYTSDKKGGEVGISDKLKEIDFSIFSNTIKGIGKSLKSATEFINPDKTSVEFFVTLKADNSNSLLAKVGGSLNGETGFKITFHWEKQQPIKQTK